MQYTNNYSLKKPQLLEPALITDLNNNADAIDTLLYQNRRISSAEYDQNASYVAGDLVVYENLFYKCTGATSGNWDSSKWTRTTLASEVELAGQSGGSDVEGNPSGTATAQLEKLRVDNDIFFINDASKVIADEYDSTVTYAVGDYCIYNTLLYKCTTAVSTAEAFDNTKWTACLVTDEMGQGGDNANQNIANEFSTSSTYVVGDYCIYESILYKCTTAVQTAGAWDSTKWTPCVVTDEMGSGGGGGSSTFAGLSDVSLTSLTDGDFPQYDANAQKWKNVAITGVSVQPVVYSTEEREVGVWIDGKPTYQKTYYCNPKVSISANSWGNIATIGEVVNVIKAEAVDNDNGQYAYYSVAGSCNNNKLSILNPRSNTGIQVEWVTFYYTKPTDTPGSGTWTPSGVPAVHYSTNEQVVGTWIDGSTLYKRTIDIMGTVNLETVNEWVDTGVDISYVSGMISAEVIAKDSMSIPALWVNKNASNHLILLSSRANTFIGLYVTICYTKSSS